MGVERPRAAMSKFIKKAFKHRSKSRDDRTAYNKTNGYNSPYDNNETPYNINTRQSRAGSAPFEVLTTIFAYIAPHCTDESYLGEEEVQRYEEGCVLCDIRDLARLAAVCLKWNAAARSLLYKNIRLESVHFCGLEEQLMEKRARRRSFLRVTDPESVDVPSERIQLLIRTFQENESFASFVWFVRMQYMTRQSERELLMKLASLLTNLRYMDLPDGFYKDEPSCQALKALMYQKCPDLRKMRWDEGSERGFVGLPADRPWQNLESVHLSSLKVDEYTILQVLSTLPYLSMLTLSNLAISDEFFSPHSQASSSGLYLPALQELCVSKCEHISFAGISAYLGRQDVQASMANLALKELNISPHLLQQILQATPRLKTFFFSAPVSRPLPRHETPAIPLLKNPSLRDISFEIRDETPARGLERPSSSYYDYLTESIRQGLLPSLRIVRVREKAFHTRIQAAVIGLENKVIRRQLDDLEVYARGWDDLNWQIGKLGEKSPVISDDDDFGAFILSAGGGSESGFASRVQSATVDYGALPPARPRNQLMVPGTAEDNRLSWKQKLENRNSRMDLWR